MESNREKLKKLILDVFLLDESEFTFELTRPQVDTWDSLGVVSLAVGVHQTFGYHLTPEEATGLTSIADLMTQLEKRGIPFDA